MIYVVDPKRRRLGPEELSPNEDVSMSPQDEDQNKKKWIIFGCCNAGPPFIISIMSWNCQCMGPPWKFLFLKDVICQEWPAFVFLCETLCTKEKMEWYRTRLGFEGMIVVEAEGRSGGLALLWRKSDQITLKSLSKYHINVDVSIEGMQSWRLT